MTDNINYWGFRLHHEAALYHEMTKGRLRQGWGSLAGQDLRKLDNGDKDAEDGGAGKNLSMFRKVKKDDILLVPVPRTVAWHKVAIVRATEDWYKAYSFEKLDGHDDFRHVFPVEYLREFHTHNQIVHGDIRKTLKCRRRFWNVAYCADHIEQILKANTEKLDMVSHGDEKLDHAINAEFKKVLDNKTLDTLFDNIQGNYDAAEWEHGIKTGLEKLAETTAGFRVETTANKTESKHGADLLIYLPNPVDEDLEYIIAVQVKDHQGSVSKAAIDQISKADEYFKEQDVNARLIEKMVLITKATRAENADIEVYAEEKGVKILFKKDFERLLSRIASSYITISRQGD